MSRTPPIAFLVSVSAHLAFLCSLWSAPQPRVVEPRRPIEVELRGAEARRAPVPEMRQATSPPPRRRGAAKAAVPALVLAVTEAPSAAPEGGGEPEEEELSGGSGGEDDEGAAPPTKPPPPPPDTNAELVGLPQIAYPENARYEGVEGVVRLWVQLDASGQVISVEIRDEPGAGLGVAAQKALLQATFKPATHLGHAVATAFEYVYRFQLW